jgi:hypothetical protein
MGLSSSNNSKQNKFNDIWWTSVVQIISKVNSEIYPWNNKKIVTIKGVGILIKINKIIYCLTTASNVNHAESIKIYVEETYSNIKQQKRLREITCKINFMSYETGLCILECDMNDFNKWKLNKHVAKLSDINPEHLPLNFGISIMNVDYKLNKELVIKKTITNATVSKLEYDNIYSEYFCKLPYYTTELKLDEKQNNAYISCPCIDSKGNLVGIIHAKNENIYDIIPAITILKIFNNQNSFSMIKNNITYETNKQKGFIFRDTDEIISIENVNVENNLVYDDVMKTYINMDAYLALNKTNYVNMTIKRNNKIFTKCIKNKSYNDIYSIKYSYYNNQPKIINFFGFNFVEPSYELLMQLKDDGFNCIDLQENIKYFLLVSIDKNKMTENIYDMFEYNPIANIKLNCLILTSINRKIIKHESDIHTNKNKINMVMNNITFIFSSSGYWNVKNVDL